MNKKKVLKKILRKVYVPKMHFYGDLTNMKSKKLIIIIGNVIGAGVRAGVYKNK